MKVSISLLAFYSPSPGLPWRTDKTCQYRERSSRRVTGGTVD